MSSTSASSPHRRQTQGEGAMLRFLPSVGWAEVPTAWAHCRTFTMVCYVVPVVGLYIQCL